MQCRLAWGWQGAREAGERGDIVVVVDALRFSTTVATTIAAGGIVYPAASENECAAMAARVNGEIAGKGGRFSLSPASMTGLTPGAKIVLWSLNGAVCCGEARAASALYVGAIVNARAVGQAVAAQAAQAEQSVTVLACGERWPTPNRDGELRFAVEDYLGAGAILAHLPLAKSPDAQVCEAAFLHCRSRIETLLWECDSGLELRERGQGDDVTFAAQLDRFDVVPIRRGDRLERL